MKTRKIAILGMGHVGAHVAYALMSQGLADELVLLDINEKKVVSEAQDLRDSVAYMPHGTRIVEGGYAELSDCDILINSVGRGASLQTMDRITEMQFTVPMVNECAEKIKQSGFAGVLVNITNPCDVITHQLIQQMDMPRGRVFGTGSCLDTARLLAVLARETGIDHKSITAYMLGEHGNAQFAPWSCVCFRGQLLERWARTDARFRFDRQQAQETAIHGGWVTVAGKGSTEYGIATVTARIVSAILHDEKAILPVSMELDGEYAESGLSVGVPCVIGKDGVEQVVEIPLTAEEMETFHACCESIRKNIRAAGI